MSLLAVTNRFQEGDSSLQIGSGRALRGRHWALQPMYRTRLRLSLPAGRAAFGISFRTGSVVLWGRLRWPAGYVAFGHPHVVTKTCWRCRLRFMCVQDFIPVHQLWFAVASSLIKWPKKTV